jgi:hypothetical protein
VYTLTGIGGSNPSLSATQSGLQRITASISPPRNLRIPATFRDFYIANWTAEKGLLETFRLYISYVSLEQR